MKVAHKNNSRQLSDEDIAGNAVKLEHEGEWALAADAWKKVISVHPLKARAYDRLMIIYRKLKEYNKELKIINAAIRQFNKKHKDRQPSFSKKVNLLSRALLKATGLADKKGNNIYQPDEVSRWQKRKELLLKRINGR
jgi:hypothetical protein